MSQSMHFMLTRAAGPAWANGWVCSDPQRGQAGRAGGSTCGVVPTVPSVPSGSGRVPSLRLDTYLPTPARAQGERVDIDPLVVGSSQGDRCQSSSVSSPGSSVGNGISRRRDNTCT